MQVGVLDFFAKLKQCPLPFFYVFGVNCIIFCVYKELGEFFGHSLQAC